MTASSDKTSLSLDINFWQPLFIFSCRVDRWQNCPTIITSGIAPAARYKVASVAVFKNNGTFKLGGQAVVYYRKKKEKKDMFSFSIL